MSHDVSILVPTKNRPEFTLRLLRYYRDAGFKGRLVIADSSSPEHAQRIEQAARAVADRVAVDYRAFPAESYSEVVRAQLRDISTPYVVLLGDDDYLVPNGLERCVEFLNSAPEYHAAHGQAACFILNAPGAHGELLSFGPYKQRAVEGETGAARLAQYLGDYFTLLYSVHRTESFRWMHRDMQVPFHPTFTEEMLPSCLSVVRGKIKELQTLYYVRQRPPCDASAVPFDFFEWMTDERFSGAYRGFRDRVADTLSRQDGLTLEQAHDAIKRAFLSLMVQGLQRTRNNRWRAASAPLAVRMKQAAKRIPGLSALWRRIRPFSLLEPLSLPALLDPASPYHRDFMLIHRTLTVSDAPHAASSSA